MREKLNQNYLQDPIFSELTNATYRNQGYSLAPTFWTTVEDYQRGKRGALQLAQMMKCATACDPLDYKGYGCYCGFLGSGDYVDGIDKYEFLLHHPCHKLT